MKFNVDIPYDEDDGFFAEMTVPGFDDFPGDKSHLSEGVLGVYQLSRYADFKTVSEFAKDIADSFDESVPLYDRTPTFRKMSLPQLRCYFTLREKFRKGRYECHDIQYLILYLNEIINLTGVKTYEKAASEIASVMSEKGSAIRNILPLVKLLYRDFYVVYNIPGSFYAFAETFGVEKFFPDSIIPENTDIKPAVFYHNALYHIPKSTGFFAAHYSADTFLRKAFFAAMKNLEPVFEFNGKSLKSLEEEYFGRLSPYKPFGGLTFTGTPTREGKAVITPSERFSVELSKITTNIVNFPKSAAIFFGFILSVIEANMRALCGYKYLLDLDINGVYDKIRDTYDKDSRFYLNLMGENDAPDIVKETVIDLYRKSVRFILKDTSATGISGTSAALRKKISAEPFVTFAYIRRSGAERERRKEYRMDIFRDQSQRLWNLRGNFGESEFTNGSYGLFSDLSPKDLATYISIRTRVRNGDLENTDGFFWSLWLSELINTDKMTEEEVFKMLAEYLEKTDSETIRKTLIAYYVYHLREKGSFYDYAKKYGIIAHYSDIFAAGDFSFEEMNRISDYSIFKSKFYTDKTAPIFEEAIPKVFSALEPFFSEKGIDFKHLLYEENNRMTEFFSGLIHEPQRLSPNEKIIISERLAFSYQYGSYFQEYRTEYESKIMPVIIGLIMKSAEITLREIYGAKGKISISDKIPEKLNSKLSSKLPPRLTRSKAGKAELLRWKRLYVAVLDPEFPEFLSQTVRKIAAEISPEALLKYSPKPEPVKIEINFEKLGEIREDSKAVAERLGAVYEEDAPKLNTTEPLKRNVESDINKEFLRLLLTGKKAKAEKLALENGTMFEVAAEKINEIFQEKIGDIVIENGEIIPDYTKEIEEFLGE
jgi:hypothetical protein